MASSNLHALVVEGRTSSALRRRVSRFAHVESFLAIATLVVACSGIAHAQILPEILPIFVDREWYYEHEFVDLPGLRAEPRHVVVLDLERTAVRGKTTVNSIPYRVSEERTFDFCVRKDDPNIRSLTFMSEDGSGVSIHVPRGAPCKTRTIGAGLYRLQVEHDGQSVSPAGAIAFVHVPRAKRTASAELLTSGTAPLDATSCHGLDTDTAEARPRYAFRTADGRWVYSASDTAGTVQVDPPPKLLTAPTINLGTGGWTTCRDVNGDYRFAMRKTGTASGYLYADQRLVNGVNIAPLDLAGDLSVPFAVTDLGNFQVGIAYHPSGTTTWPVFVGTDNLLHWFQDVNGNPQRAAQPTPLVNAITYYPPGTTVPDLLPGEAALTKTTTSCNNDSTHGTWVVRGDIPDIGAISYTDPFTGKTESLPRYGGMGNPGDSVRLGPRTVFQMFRSTFYTPPAITYIGESQSCVWFQDQTASFKVAPAEQFIASTNECGTCNLSGIDLSNLDLTRSQFDSSNFNGANLTNTIFRNGSMTYADFSGSNTRLAGTDFGNARIGSSRFRNTDLSTANMQSDQPLANFVDFYAATLLVDTMYPEHWHYGNDFNSATFKDSNGATVSSKASPLDLSNAKMRGVHLEGITLTGANVSGADFTGAHLSFVGLESAFATQPVTFNSADLTKASLKNASFPNSFFRCASMSPTNLGGADLSASFLEQDATVSPCGSTSLAHSYMFNTRLTNARMTDAVLDFVSWYNTDASGAATGEGAIMTHASFKLADLPNLRLAGAVLDNATLDDAQLIGANLSNASVKNGEATTANFRGAVLNGTNFSFANLTDAAVSTTQDSQIFIEVLTDPDRYQKPLTYQYFAVNRPPTAGAPNTANAICPSGGTGGATGCGPFSDPKWVPTNPPQEPTDCKPSQYDDQGNVIAITCSSSRHPA